MAASIRPCRQKISAAGPGTTVRDMIIAMGASGWHARTSYQDSIDAALQQARLDAYNRGDFYRRPPNEQARSMGEEEYVAWGIERTKASLPPELADAEWSGDEYRDEWHAARIVVTGPDTLLSSQPESGTHSVIDMTHVADKPTYNAVAPASVNYLQELFGTPEPAVTAIEDAIAAGRIDDFGRWCGIYLIGYQDGRPDTIFFVGHSGD
jgi:hypothetical protein